MPEALEVLGEPELLEVRELLDVPDGLLELHPAARTTAAANAAHRVVLSFILWPPFDGG